MRGGWMLLLVGVLPFLPALAGCSPKAAPAEEQQVTLEWVRQERQAAESEFETSRTTFYSVATGDAAVDAYSDYMGACARLRVVTEAAAALTKMEALSAARDTGSLKGALEQPSVQSWWQAEERLSELDAEEGRAMRAVLLMAYCKPVATPTGPEKGPSLREHADDAHSR